MSRFARKLRRARGPLLCKGCGQPLYVNDSPSSSAPTFCNNGSCDRCLGKPLPPEMLAQYRMAW